MGKTKTALIVETELYTRLSLITGHGKDVVRDVIKALNELVIDELKNETPVRLGAIGEITTITCRRCGGHDFENHCMKPTKVVRCAKFKPSIKLKRAIKLD